MAEKIATREAYGKALLEFGAKNENIVVFDADLAEATKTCLFKKEFPERFFDCGIAENNMLSDEKKFELAIDKGTPILRDMAEDVKVKTLEVSKQVVKKLETKEKTK